jgi:uncharacterized membrane protein YhaH (DUF805 family)
MNWINILLGREGRINRKTFLIGLMPILLLFALSVFYLKFLTGILPLWADALIPLVISLEGLFFLANLSLKRMHDYGRSAPYLGFLFSPLIVATLFLVQQKFITLKAYEVAVIAYTILISLAVIAFLWMLIEMLFLRSDEQTNSYGPPPVATKQ